MGRIPNSKDTVYGQFMIKRNQKSKVAATFPPPHSSAWEPIAFYWFSQMFLLSKKLMSRAALSSAGDRSPTR